MPVDQFVRIYEIEDFVSLPGAMNIPALATALGALTLSVSVADVRAAPPPSSSVVVELSAAPSGADRIALDAAVAAFAISAPVEGPFEFNDFAASTTTSAAHVSKIDQTTPALKAGLYSVSWNSTLRMATAAANSGVEGRIRFDRSDGAFLQQSDAWDLTAGHAFNGSTRFYISEGQTIRARLTYARLGAGGLAEISGGRITIDRVADG